MDETPNYSFYRNPRFSANHLAEYLCTKNADQRDAVIRKAKFPRKVNVAAYQQVVPTMRATLSSNTRDMGQLDALLQRLALKAEREEGYARDEAVRCAAAIEAFKATFAAAKLGKAQFGPGPRDVAMKLEGVTVNTRLDPPVFELGADGRTFGGGCVMLFANSAETRKNIEDRRKYVAAITHWSLEAGETNVEIVPRLCLSLDVFGKEVIRAPTSNTLLRKTVTASCREAASKWAGIEPPAGYDGPDWR